MTLAEMGLYRLMLDVGWLKGGSLPANLDELLEDLGLQQEEFRAAWTPLVQGRFQEVDGRLVNRRQARELAARQAYREQQAEHGAKAHAKRSKGGHGRAGGPHPNPEARPGKPEGTPRVPQGEPEAASGPIPSQPIPSHPGGSRRAGELFDSSEDAPPSPPRGGGRRAGAREAAPERPVRKRKLTMDDRVREALATLPAAVAAAQEHFGCEVDRETRTAMASFLEGRARRHADVPTCPASTWSTIFREHGRDIPALRANLEHAAGEGWKKPVLQRRPNQTVNGFHRNGTPASTREQQTTEHIHQIR
jgi:uncharacterized protein YdaU (DUF1376 family)